MDKRPGVIAAVGVLLALATGCSSTHAAGAPAKPSPTTAFPDQAVASYQTEIQTIAPDLQPWTQVLADSEKFCTELRSGVAPAMVMTRLEQRGWSYTRALRIGIYAAGQEHTLCPDQWKTFHPWMMDTVFGTASPDR